MKPVSNRVAFFDSQCSAQKSVSILVVLGGDKRLRTAHEEVARIALAELERFASRQKNTPLQGRSELTGNICAAAFTHNASRALDPQLHTHFVIANATCDRPGTGSPLTNTRWSEPARFTRTRWPAPFRSWATVSGWCGKVAKSPALRSRGYPIRFANVFQNAERRLSVR